MGTPYCGCVNVDARDNMFIIFWSLFLNFGVKKITRGHFPKRLKKEKETL